MLKNGNKIEVIKTWKEDGLIKGNKGKGIIGFPEDSVADIIREKDEEHDSFEFDMWKGDINIQKAFQIAELHDLPINKVGIVSSYPKFNQKVYNYINSSNLFYYKTKLLGKYAQVILCFTPTSRLLHKVIINFTGYGSNTKEFENEVLIMLKSKYGDKNKYGFELFGNTRTWSVGNKYKIVLTKQGSIKIEYIDNILEIKNAAITEKWTFSYICTDRDRHSSLPC